MIRNQLAKSHIVTGIVTVVVFLGTGLYMRANFPALYESNEVIRYLFRANHVYILFSGLLNIVLGTYVVYHDAGWRRKLQLLGSWLLLAVPVVFIVAFIVEPPQASPMRPLTLIGAFATLVGIVAHMVGGRSLRND